MKDRLSAGVLIAGGLVLAIQLLSIWLTPDFYTQDGPAHVYTASVFLEILQNPDGLVAATYEMNDWRVPTWTGSMLLVALVHIFGPLIGEKVLILLIVASLAGGFYGLLKAVSPRARWGWLLILPFLLNHLLLIGLYFFLLATGVSMIFMGWAWKRRSSFGWREAGISAVCFLLCFHIHPIPSALAGGALLFHFALPDASGGGWRDRLPNAGRLILAGLPCALWSIAFLGGGGESGLVVGGRGFAPVFEDIVAVAVLAPFTKTPHLWAVLCFALMAVISIWCLFQWVRERSLPRAGLVFCFFGITLFTLSALAPEGVKGGSLMGYRLGFLLWLVWLVALVVEVERTRWSVARISLIVVFLGAALFQTARIRERQQSIQPFLTRLESVSRALPAETRVWPLAQNLQGLGVDGRVFAPRNSFFSHVGLRFLDARKAQVAMIFYQGQVDHFAIRFRDIATTGYFRRSFDARPDKYVPMVQPGDVVLWVGGKWAGLEEGNGDWKKIATEPTLFGPVGAAILRE